MSTNHDDPRLTTFALNELASVDRAAFERQLADSPNAAAEVASIREMADELRIALQSEPALPLTDFVVPTQLVPHDARMPSVRVVAEPFSPRNRWISRIAIAVSCVALLGTFSWITWSTRTSSSRMARQSLALREPSPQPVQSRYFDVADENGNGHKEIELSVVDAFNAPSTDLPVASFQVANRVEQEESVRLRRLSSVPTNSNDRYLGKQRGRHMLSDVRKLTELEKARSSGLGGEQHLSESLMTDLSVVDGLQDSVATNGKGFFLPPVVAESKFGRTDESRPEVRLSRQEQLLQEHRDQPSAEDYAKLNDNPFFTPLAQPLSTFSIDVDTAAYSNMRRFLTQGSWPPADAVRIEEMVNYFAYDYTPPGADISNVKSQIPNPDAPFAVHMEVAGCPWNAEHRLVRVGLKGKEIALDKRPVSNIVFLIDVSGSMQPENRLPLVKAGLRRLIDQLGENDRVGIVVYAGASGLALDSTNATQKDVILSSIENLQAGGSTNGGEGIQLAYALARKHFIPKGTNRVILCTDGDFNVGITNQDDLTRLIEEQSKSGVFLSVLGFGMGNLKDSTLEKLADKGNGNYAYIDTLREANKVFVEQMTGTLITIAKDVKIQIEFNPSQVGAYRLIGYENRLLAAQDFHADTKDAGEIGAGHTVTALYEIIPPSKLPAQPKVSGEEKLKYQPNAKSTAPTEGQGQIGDAVRSSANNELLTIKLRYKQPDAEKSQLIEQPLIDSGNVFAKASTDFRFAASVASFGMILRGSPHRGDATLDSVAEIAESSMGVDKSGYRSEFVGLVRSAKALRSPK